MPALSPSTSVAREPADPAVVESLLRSLPACSASKQRSSGTSPPWPGSRPTWPATPTPCAAELHLMAVDPAHHRAGIGRALLRAAETDLAADGVHLVQVKTLGPSRADPNYARTRMFYEACGFQPLEEIHGLWGDNPCLIMVKTLALAHR